MMRPFLAYKVLEPFKQLTFRQIWFGGLLSNLGQMVLTIGAAWKMTSLTRGADFVALVQTSSMAPIVLVSLISGALADTYDRRIVALTGLSIALVSALGITTLGIFGLIEPLFILGACFFTGCGVALFSPAWQASVSEQVPAEVLPAAITLNSISYNIARSFGPALGGVIVAGAGTTVAFMATAVLYVPLLFGLYNWRRKRESPILGAERLSKAIVSGVSFALRARVIRISLVRCFITGSLAGSLLALIPLVVRDLLNGGPRLFGLLLGSFGIGAVVGALNAGVLRAKLDTEGVVRVASMALGVSLAVVAFSRLPFLTMGALVVAGASWISLVALFNITVQVGCPRWVVGRAVAAFQTALASGLAIGSWGWGYAAQHYGIESALFVSGVLVFFSPVVGIWQRMPKTANLVAGCL